jgi:2-oxoglutarate/2-oxoacid ferredoxin oxidoreductase subunit beta
MTDSRAEIKTQSVNSVGLSRNDYAGAPSTLCQGCGHNSIAAQIVSALYELNIKPEKVMKFSGIGCSSKSPTYFLGRSFGFNSLHGRMPSLATGAAFADTSLKIIAVSGDGDTASIGMGQFKHLTRRNLSMVYLVENNGVYGLTKGQFSATIEPGIELKKQGKSRYLPVDICMEALASHATFVARSFAGDPSQVKNLIKAAMGHRGIAIIDIISPCVTFNNLENTLHSYSFGKEHEARLHDMEFVPYGEEIMVNDFEKGTTREVMLHDKSIVVLKKLGEDHDPTSRSEAFRILEESYNEDVLITGLIYINTELTAQQDMYNIPVTPLNRTPNDQLRPSRESLDKINEKMI